jgi:hypothetical protein
VRIPGRERPAAHRGSTGRGLGESFRPPGCGGRCGEAGARRCSPGIAPSTRANAWAGRGRHQGLSSRLPVGRHGPVVDDLLADRRSCGASAGGDPPGSRTCSTEPGPRPPDTPRSADATAGGRGRHVIEISGVPGGIRCARRYQVCPEGPLPLRTPWRPPVTTGAALLSGRCDPDRGEVGPWSVDTVALPGIGPDAGLSMITGPLTMCELTEVVATVCGGDPSHPVTGGGAVPGGELPGAVVRPTRRGRRRPGAVLLRPSAALGLPLGDAHGTRRNDQ